VRVERSGGEELSSYARGAAGSLPRARRESASVRASRSVTSIARTRLRLRGPTSAGRRRLRARASNALRPAPGLTITHFSSRGRLNLTRVSRSTSWCIPRPRRRSLCVSVCFSRRARPERRRGLEICCRRGGGRRSRWEESGPLTPASFGGAVIARGRSVRRPCSASFDAPRPAPGRDTVRQRSWPGGRTELLDAAPLDTPEEQTERWVRPRMRDPHLLLLDPAGPHEARSDQS